MKRWFPVTCFGVLQTIVGAAVASPSAPLVIRDVSVIDVKTGTVATHRTVRIADSHIVAIIPTAAEAYEPKSAQVIDGRGRFLAPGFTDMHAHLNSRIEAREKSPLLTLSDEDILSIHHLAAFLYNGVTTLQVMHGDEGMLALRDAISQGAQVGPQLVVGSPRLDGNPPSGPYPRIVGSAAEGLAVVDEMHAAGYDFIKVYDRLGAPAYDAIVTRAHSYGMRVDGHLPRTLPLEHALHGMQDHVTHAEEFVAYSHDFSDADIARITKEVKESGIGVTPTLTVFKNVLRSVKDLREVLAAPEIRYADPLVFHAWLPERNPYRSERFQAPSVRAALTRQFEFMKKLVLAFQRAGVPLVIGTDCNISGTVAGFSVPEEMQEIAGLGISAADVLRMATLNAAVALRMQTDLGTVEPGKRADLVLLERNPLMHIANVRGIAGVVVRGRWYSHTDLQRALDGATQAFSRLDERLRTRQTRTDTQRRNQNGRGPESL
ncbi:MAG: amidohydrolase family protein [Proteobacteria bacterium]|nr:amidohydrolase family protein [Pseudomonadota bacterium]